MKNEINNNFQLEEEYTKDDIISEINLKHGRSAYSLYIMNNFSKEKINKSNLKPIEIFKILSEKWRKITSKEKEKYMKISKEEKEKYKKDFKTFKKYFLSKENENSNSFQIYYNSLIQEYFNKEEIKEIKKKAYENWKKMSEEEKLKYNNKIINPENWIEKIKTIKYIKSYVIFIYKSISDSKEKKEEIPDFKFLKNKWEKMDKNERKKYEDYANEIISERKKIKNLFEKKNVIKPKKPIGAYRIFLSEKAKEGFFQGKKNIFKEGRILWNKLSKEEKDEYLNKAKKIRLCFIYKKLLYKKNFKNNLPKKPKTAYNFFIASMKGKKYDKGDNFFNMCKREWEKLSKNEKEKFEIEAEKDRIKYEKKMNKLQYRIYDLPKRAKTSFQIFITEKFDLFKNDYPDLNNREILVFLAKEWNFLDENIKERYEIKAEKDHERFIKQNNKFQEKGYYVQTKEQREENFEKNNINMNEKKRSKLLIQYHKKKY